MCLLREQSVGGQPVYVGTVAEIAALLREHAGARDRSGDYFIAAAMRRAAEEFGTRVRPEYLLPAAVYCVEEADGGQFDNSAELVDARGTP